MHRLEVNPLHRFRDWPEPDVPARAPGAYSVWFEGRLLYVGAAGTRLGPPPRRVPRGRGLRTRLDTVVSARPDPLSVLVCEFLLLPMLTAAQIRAVARGHVTLADLTRAFIRDALAYRVVVTRDGREAKALAERGRSGLLYAGLPLLNPL